MAFDLKTAALPAAHNDGAFMPLFAPNGTVYQDDDGKPVGITLRSRLSRLAQAKQRELAAARVQRTRSGRENTIEDVEDEQTALLVACTVSWTFSELDGKPFECTSDNAWEFWSDPRFIQHREHAVAFLNNDANFSRR